MSGEIGTVETGEIARHEQDGRVLSGGADPEKLAETMDRHAPADPEAPKPAAVQADAKPAEPAPAQSRGQRRYSELVSQRDEAKAAADAAKAEREAIARERDDLKARLSTPQPSAEQPKPAEAAKPTRPEPQEDEIGTKYQNWADFSRDLAKWDREQEIAQQTQTVEERVREILAQQNAETTFVSTAKAAQDRGRRAYADFDTLLKGPGGKIPMGRNGQESMERAKFIIEHPASEHIQYAILKDAALAEKLQQSDSFTFGALVSSLIPAEKPKAAAWTPPPPPHPTVGASSSTTPTPSSELAKKGYDFDNSGYREKRAAERKARGGR